MKEDWGVKALKRLIKKIKKMTPTQVKKLIDKTERDFNKWLKSREGVVMNHKTTDRHFKIFCQEAQYWIDYFCLYEQSWRFFHRDCEKNRAQFKSNSDDADHVCYLILGTSWHSDIPTDYSVRESAFHEVCEGLFFGIRNSLAINTAWGGVVNHEIHRVIRILEHTLFKRRKI